MYLLDTNHCSHLLNRHTKVLQRLEELGDTPVATCVIVCGELHFMVFRSREKEINLKRLREFLQEIEIYHIDEIVAKFYGQIKAEIYDHFGPKEKAVRKKTKLESLGFSENDLWIAAIAKRYGLIIVSADSDFQRLQEVDSLPVENWGDP
jgi:tRNA(fMet)-specific endonuclease VapC